MDHIGTCHLLFFPKKRKPIIYFSDIIAVLCIVTFPHHYYCYYYYLFFFFFLVGCEKNTLQERIWPQAIRGKRVSKVVNFLTWFDYVLFLYDVTLTPFACLSKTENLNWHMLAYTWLESMHLQAFAIKWMLMDQKYGKRGEIFLLFQLISYNIVRTIPNSNSYNIMQKSAKQNVHAILRSSLWLKN